MAVFKKAKIMEEEGAAETVPGEDTGNDRKKRFKRPRKIKKKRIIIAGILLALAVCGGILLYKLFLGTDEQVVLTGTTTYGALDGTIEGTGTTLPADSVSYSLAATAEILEVKVEAGDEVQAGDLLFKQDDSTVDDEILDYRESLNEYEDSLQNYQDQLATLNEDLQNLTIKAEVSGHLKDVSVEVGDTVKSGDTLAVLADDSTMKITQYFSYVYEDDIYKGQSATVSVPDLMLNLTGAVTDIKKVERITDEGTKCFAVTISVTNAGALTEGMSVGGYVIGSDGGYIYPAVEGTLEYADTIDITAECSGELLKVNAIDYQDVTKGDTLFVISGDDYTSQITSLENQIERAETQIEGYNDKITEAEESRSDYEVYSDISGKVIFCNIKAGTTYKSGVTAIAVYNIDTMQISVNIDELDIDYIEKGMEVTIIRSGAEKNEEYTGTVSEVSLEATTTDGVSTFPVTIEIQSNGDLSPGVSVSYYISTGDTDETVLCPVDAIQYLDEGTVVFVKADDAPENTIEITSDVEVPDGFYPVLVETGTSSAAYIRILSGLEEDQEVFTGYQQEAPSGGDTTSESQDSTQTNTGNNNFGPGGNMGEMPSGGFSGGGPGGMGG
ncbi:MAG: efflux RND transporter periplasmic adaptor subunit [Oscillospiraceae bacterium]